MNYSELKINSHVGNFSCYISEETLVLWALSCFLLTIHIWMKNCTGRGNRKGKLHCYFVEINQAPWHHTPRGVSGKALKEREWGISKSPRRVVPRNFSPKAKNVHSTNKMVVAPSFMLRLGDYLFFGFLHGGLFLGDTYSRGL